MSQTNNAPLGIVFILVGVFAISVNDLLIKYLSGGYPLHQLVAIRSVIGLTFTTAFLMREGGFGLLRTATPGLHALRCLLVIGANMTYYAAVVVMPLAQAMALFFVAPLFITLLSIPLLGERVGIWRMSAVIVGFGGALIMQQPWAVTDADGPGRVALFLPVLAAALYALMQVLTRRLGVASTAAAMAFYIQSGFLLTSLLFFAVAGDGRFAGSDDPGLDFLLRAWIVPPRADWMLLGLLGCCAGVIGYSLSAAYRLTDAATVAPFEYIGLPLAIFWGWSVFGEWPDATTWLGCALIVGAGAVVFLREQRRDAPSPGRRARWGRR